jgi:putative hemolysin
MIVCLNIVFNPININVIVDLCLVASLLLGVALISASEVAYFSLKPADIKQLEVSKSKNGKLVLKLLENQEKLLSNIIITTIFLNISLIILLVNLFSELITVTGSHFFELTFQLVVISFLVLILGNVIPKLLAANNPIKVAKFMVFIMNILSVLVFPLTILLLMSSRFIQNRISDKQNLSISDLNVALDITSATLSEERNILKGIVKFGYTDVSEVMRPRVDVVAVENDITLSKLFSVIVETGYSRIPVYENTLDNIKGILLTKDLLPYLHENNSYYWQALVKPAYFVPETKKIDDLLAEFQKNKNHLAIVIDEYGGTCGLVTMEDILEEVIGEISDESDVEEEVLYKKLSYNVYLFEAKILLNDLFKVTGIPDDVFDKIKGEYETLAGLILELKGDIPHKNDRLEYNNFTFIIESVDKRRIKQVKLIVG